MEETEPSGRLTDRRSFLLKGAAVGVGAIGASRLLAPPSASASGGLTKGDVAILQFLAAAELLEADLWEQYNELGGIQDRERAGGSGNKAYTRALSVLDKDLPQYIHDNADDEQSHANFINAYLEANGAEPINLDKFRTLPSSQGHRRASNRPADQPDGAHHRHQLVDALPQSTRRTPTSATPCPTPSRTLPSVSTRRFRAATTI